MQIWVKNGDFENSGKFKTPQNQLFKVRVQWSQPKPRQIRQSVVLNMLINIQGQISILLFGFQPQNTKSVEQFPFAPKTRRPSRTQPAWLRDVTRGRHGLGCDLCRRCSTCGVIDFLLLIVLKMISCRVVLCVHGCRVQQTCKTRHRPMAGGGQVGLPCFLDKMFRPTGHIMLVGERTRPTSSSRICSDFF